MQGLPLKSYEITKQLIEKTSTTTGLKVTANIINNVYEKSKKVADDYKEPMKIKFDKNLGQWNYRVIPISFYGNHIDYL
jgi:hypothetical protein